MKKTNFPMTHTFSRTEIKWKGKRIERNEKKNWNCLILFDSREFRCQTRLSLGKSVCELVLIFISTKIEKFIYFYRICKCFWAHFYWFHLFEMPVHCKTTAKNFFAHTIYTFMKHKYAVIEFFSLFSNVSFRFFFSFSLFDFCIVAMATTRSSTNREFNKQNQKRRRKHTFLECNKNRKVQQEIIYEINNVNIHFGLMLQCSYYY